jgi:type VI protein secretion system component VasK
MIERILYLASLIVAAACGAIWGLWQGEKNNSWLKKKNEALNQALESERKANEALKKWLKFYRERENVRS